MEAKGKSWNRFASKYDFEVKGKYQHYYCYINGTIDLLEIKVNFKGQREYVDLVPQGRFDISQSFWNSPLHLIIT